MRKCHRSTEMMVVVYSIGTPHNIIVSLTPVPRWGLELESPDENETKLWSENSEPEQEGEGAREKKKKKRE